MMQCPCQGGLIVILISYHTGLFELPDRTERLKKEREKKKTQNGGVFNSLFHVLCIELDFWGVSSD